MLEIYDGVSVSSIDILGQEDVTDGSVDYYDFDWGEAVEVDESTIFAGCAGRKDGDPYPCPDPCPDPEPEPDPCPCPDPCPPCPCPDPEPEPEPDPEPQPGPCTSCEGEDLPNDGADYGIIDI